MKLHVDPNYLDDIVDALVKQDSKDLADKMDAALTFSGVGADLAEALDGPLASGIAPLVMLLRDALVERMAPSRLDEAAPARSPTNLFEGREDLLPRGFSPIDKS